MRIIGSKFSSSKYEDKAGVGTADDWRLVSGVYNTTVQNNKTTPVELQRAEMKNLMSSFKIVSR